MKEPHSKDLSKMHTVIKCTDHNKHKVKKDWKPKLTEQQLVRLYDTEWTHQRRTSIDNVLQLPKFKHSKGVWCRLQGTCRQSM